MFFYRLESLDGALHERDVCKMENESLKEQNDQLFQQYEKEKSLHKDYQQVKIFDYFFFFNVSRLFSVTLKSKIISKKSNVKTMKNFPVSNRSLKSLKLKLEMHRITLED